MDNKIKDEWVSALRDDKRYLQGHHTLKSGLIDQPKYCCLGVLTDLYLQETKQSWVDRQETGTMYENCSLLPGIVNEWAGQIGKDHKAILMGMNDNHGFNFKEIADYIEKEL